MPDRPRRKEAALCPSSTAREGAILLGVVQADGDVGFLEQQVVVDRNFVEIAKKGRDPEKRFRFSSPCAMGACKQWKDGRCGVIDFAVERAQEVSGRGLPNCSIRARCRWYDQHGLKACQVCPLIITDVSDVQAPTALDEFKQLMISDAIGTFGTS